MSLDGGKKPGYPDKTYADTREKEKEDEAQTRVFQITKSHSDKTQS